MLGVDRSVSPREITGLLYKKNCKRISFPKNVCQKSISLETAIVEEKSGKTPKNLEEADGEMYKKGN